MSPVVVTSSAVADNDASDSDQFRFLPGAVVVVSVSSVEVELAGPRCCCCLEESREPNGKKNDELGEDPRLASMLKG